MKTRSPTHGPAGGRRILVAEDDPVSREVTDRMLRRLGAEVVVVNNGAEAIARLTQDRFDAVFMDVRMPEMDGLEATRTIRAPSSAVLDHDVPVIASTAQGSAATRAECLRGGMTDFVEKPFEKASLERVLERVLGAAVAEAPLPEPEDGTPRPLADLDTSALERRLGGNPEDARHIVDLFLLDCEDALRDLAGALEAELSRDVALVAHTLKGSAANVGALRIEDLAKELQARARSGNLAGARALSAELRSAFEDLKNLPG